FAASAGTLAAGIFELVAWLGAERLQCGGSLFAHSDFGGYERLGDVWLREDARLSLGDFFGGAGGGPEDWVWRQLWTGGLAAGAGRTSLDAAAIDCDTGRHGAR